MFFKYRGDGGTGSYAENTFPLSKGNTNFYQGPFKNLAWVAVKKEEIGFGYIIKTAGSEFGVII